VKASNNWLVLREKKKNLIGLFTHFKVCHEEEKKKKDNLFHTSLKDATGTNDGKL